MTWPPTGRLAAQTKLRTLQRHAPRGRHHGCQPFDSQHRGRWRALSSELIDRYVPSRLCPPGSPEAVPCSCHRLMRLIRCAHATGTGASSRLRCICANAGSSTHPNLLLECLATDWPPQRHSRQTAEHQRLSWHRPPTRNVSHTWYMSSMAFHDDAS